MRRLNPLHFLYNKWNWKFVVVFLLLVVTSSYLYSLYKPWGGLWLENKEFWYTLHWKGERVGYVWLNYKTQNDDLIQVTQTTHVKTINRNKSVILKEKEVYQFDNNSGELTSIFYQQQIDDFYEQLSLNKRGNSYDGEQLVGNQKVDIKIPLADYRFDEFLLFMRWASQKPGIGDTIVVRNFDPRTLTFNPVTYEIMSHNSINSNTIS